MTAQNTPLDASMSKYTRVARLCHEPKVPEPLLFREVEDGDLCVILQNQGERITLKVSSNALCLASSVWKKFIFPPFQRLPIGEVEKDQEGINHHRPRSKKSRPLEQLAGREIDFTDDDFFAITLLFGIAHLQFENIPTWLSYPQLFEVAILCDQYDCAPLVRPWLSKWGVNEQELLPNWQAPWLFISCTFGREAIFQRLVQNFVLTVKVNGAGDCLDPYKCRVFPQPTPAGVIESILEVRLEIIKRLLQVAYADLQRFERRFVTSCMLDDDQHLCDAVKYGSLLKALGDAALWPPIAASEVFWSVEELSERIKRLNILQLPHFDGSAHHDTCSPRKVDFEERLKIALSNIPDPLLDSHRLHFKNLKAREKAN